MAHDPRAHQRVAFVTGAASGIGEALCMALARRKHQVVVSDRDADGAERVALAIRDAGGNARAQTLDVTDAEAFSAAILKTCSLEGRIDFLFNNAGVGLAGAVEDLELKDWKLVIDVNLWGVVHGVDATYQRMIDQGFGHIINIASGAALAPRPGMTAYATVKSAVLALTLSLRAEAALHGVKVGAACPGFVATNIQTNTRFKRVDGAGLMAKVPFKPLSPTQCAEAILRGMDRDRAVILDSGYVWLDWLMFRASPALSTRLQQWRAKQFRAHRQ